MFRFTPPPRAYRPVDIEDAAQAQGGRATAHHREGDWVSQAQIYRRGAIADHPVAMVNSRMRAAVLTDVTLLDTQYPLVGDLLVHEAMHHNVGDQLPRLINERGEPQYLMRRRLRFGRSARPREGLHFLVGGDNASFWHFLYNFALRLSIVAEAEDRSLREEVPLAIAEDSPKSFVDILPALGFDPSRLRTISRTSAERFEALMVSETPYYQSPDRKLYAAQDAARFVRERLPSPRRSDRRIYISRRDANWRRVSNEAELLPVLERFGFEVLALSQISAQALVQGFSEAELVIGPSGSNLGALLFCRPGTTVVELSYEPAVRKYYFQGACGMGELRCFKLEGVAEPTPRDYVTWDFAIAPDELVDLLKIAGFNERPVQASA